MTSVDDKALTSARADVSKLLAHVAAKTARERVNTVQRILATHGSA